MSKPTVEQIERVIVKLRKSKKTLTLHSIACELGYTRERIRQICSENGIDVAKLRNEDKAAFFVSSVKGAYTETKNTSLPDLVRGVGLVFQSKDLPWYEQTLKDAHIPYLKTAYTTRSKFTKFALALPNPELYTASEIAHMAGVPNHANPRQSLGRAGVNYRRVR